jgi:molybdopterin-containing oxidoreductase family iron-sulfur binding subunit
MWRSVGERDLPPEWRSIATPEFALGADQWPPGMDRREFVRLMGASLALGGLAACTRPAGLLVPYVTPPEEALPGSPEYYATAVPTEGYARGILVESHLGRPTKIEGNPDHPESGGSTDALTQAAILSLYDPDRSKAPSRRGAVQSWGAFEAEWRALRPELLAARGRGLALLAEPTTSPTFLREMGLLLAAFPEAQWFQHTPLASYGADGAQPDYDFGRARVVLFIGSDCLFRHPACLRYCRDYASRRRISGLSAPRSRAYAIEATPTLTGAAADFRLPASPGRMRVVLDAVSALMDGRVAGGAALTAAESAFAASLARDLRSAAPDVLCVAGPEQDPDVQAWALALNARLGAPGRTLHLLPQVRSDGDLRGAGALDRLAASLRGGEVRALLILGSNPAYTSAEFRGAAGALERVPFSVHVGSHLDETGALCLWHLPEAHFLEAWDDRRGYDGTASIVQPLIEPLYGGRSVLEVLHGLHTEGAAASYGLVRQTWQGGEGADFEVNWARWLRQGTIDGTRSSALGRAPDPATPVLSRPDAAGSLVLLLVPDASVLDGRWSNNAWLQELPRPLTQLVWDNAALISPSLAASLGAQTGDMLRIEDGSAVVEAAAYVLPGHAPGCVSLSLGYGRTRAGSVGSGLGFDATPLRRAGALWSNSRISVRRTGATHALVTTQHHFTMEGRDPVRLLQADRLHSGASDPTASLYPAWKPGAHAWGMSIDLGTCIGCNACVVACQAENNIPVVGKDQVSRGREMHWIRIDRYFEGDPAAPRILNQPVTCMHCENAPCEVVCPVGATVHSSEGLNEMVYNRCVGTRYCSNNCPYKVRRFNFLDYTDKRGSPVNLQKNPDVTVRARGVMEKCTYCVQRINTARIDAAKADRPIRDGEIRTACEQACPLGAIVFGNVADPGSRVAALKREPANYSLLGELNTRPRTTYLARVTQELGGNPI